MRLFILLAAGAMLGSYFVTWLEPPSAAPELSPHAVIGDQLQQMAMEGPWQVWVFLGGFAAAGLALLTALAGQGSGIMCLLAGLSPVTLGVYFYTRADELRDDLGLPFTVDFQDLEQAYALLEDLIRAGLWMYVGGAAVLLLLGIAMTLGKR